MNRTHRTALGLSFFALLAGSGYVLGRSNSPEPSLSSAFVGTWSLPSADPSRSPTLMTLHADGTVLASQVAPGGNTAFQGVWSPTGENRASVNMQSLAGDDKTFTYVGTARLRATMTLDTSGVLHGEGTLEATDRTGKQVFSLPSHVKGYRLRLGGTPTR